MPYSKIYRRKDGKYCFRNEETTKEVCADTRENATEALGIRQAIHENPEYAQKLRNR